MKKARDDFNRFGSGVSTDRRDADAGVRKFTGSILTMGKQLAGFMAVWEIFRGLSRALRGTANVGMSFEAVMSQVEAISGAADIQLSRLGRDALRLGSSTRYTSTQVGQLQINLSKLGFKPRAIRESTEIILALATATGEDLTTSAEVAGGVLRAFHYDASQAGRVADVINTLTGTETDQPLSAAQGKALYESNEVDPIDCLPDRAGTLFLRFKV